MPESQPTAWIRAPFATRSLRIHRLAAVLAVVLAGCASAAAPTPSPVAQSTSTLASTASPTLTPTPTSALPSGMCQLPDLVGPGYWSKDVHTVWGAAGFTGGANVVGDDSGAGFTVVKQDPAYPGTAPCDSGVTVYGPGPTPTPTLDPNAAAEPAEAQLAAACEHGTPIADAAALGGATHPFVTASQTGGTWSFWVRTKADDAIGMSSIEYHQGVLTSNGLEPVQLVVCHFDAIKGDSIPCGVYTDPNGNSANVTLTEMSETIRVVVAQTGKTLGGKTFAGDMTCPQSVGQANVGSYADPGAMEAWTYTLTKTYRG
jgi:hypothetical protein